ncbi:MAG: sulfotransferase [Desulfosalsimonas sp.]
MRTGTQRSEQKGFAEVSESVVLVSGLPRSGTSMMMRMLKAGGMPVVTDNIRGPDEDNPAGYYELEKIKQIKQDASWLKSEKGRAIKAISAFLPFLPEDIFYYVIFMKRNMGEILASQRKMLERRGGQDGDTPDELLAEKYEKYLEATFNWLEKKDHFRVFYVNYADIVRDPAGQAGAVKEFLGLGLDTEKMAQAVDPGLYRQRIEKAV